VFGGGEEGLPHEMMLSSRPRASPVAGPPGAQRGSA
jgi:hypothetical protein